MNDSARPSFRSLDRDECMAILGRNSVGRIAYTSGNRVQIEPLSYVQHGAWLYGRTSNGSKLAATSTHWAPVAFEVDEVEAVFQWRSVVVHGGFYTLVDDGRADHDAEWWQGVQLLRGLIPDTFSGDDPVGFRTVLFRMAVQDVTGREAVPGRVPVLAVAAA
ncbi:pyridoxamine 5'-phosphate oxidase family protein [Longimicrobium terrae]|uniref:Pyridoxamine 5'-phosphate oxidase family protein n=1 Tax=Longimicrobium terrae TaxID=1639882 RepID=A0A841GZY2_9BACT|nr:pyridoxamine 5'-phosphate oxidase family protein [Longimicrobium terrae]MBB4637080.1 hypothetical protein [Longimicrobium terrae]MBB6071312.1 hypothetical protein [Longimicrobium terrae]NNC31469.1 pyridoxamine 5'-phosphate oxidase family protein [Longimicrobium terrae]